MVSFSHRPGKNLRVSFEFFPPSNERLADML